MAKIVLVVLVFNLVVLLISFCLLIRNRAVLELRFRLLKKAKTRVDVVKFLKLPSLDYMVFHFWIPLLTWEPKEEKMVGRKGFTLIELLVVLVIISILAGFGVPGVIKALQNSKVGVAKSQMAYFETVERQIWNNVGCYVRLRDFSEGNQDSVRAFDCSVLGQDDVDVGVTQLPEKVRSMWAGPYDVPKNVNTINQPLDPWNHPYRMFWIDSTYAYSSPVIPTGFSGTMVLISAGQNGVLESLDDGPTPDYAVNFETFNPDHTVDDIIFPFVFIGTLPF
jgi:prepilin-type N-terminal cleavage/methylation domain-containing protein